VIVWAALLFLLALTAVSASVHAGDYPPGEVIVKLDQVEPAADHPTDLRFALERRLPGLLEWLSVTEVHAIFPELTATRDPFGLRRVLLIRYAAPLDPREVAELIGRSPDVAYAHPNYFRRCDAAPNDPRFGEQWAHDVLMSTLAWEIQKGSADLAIAVVDTGIDMDHPDLAPQIWRNPWESANGADDDGDGLVDDLWGWDFAEHDNDPDDDVDPPWRGHGTHTAGIAAAATNNGIGVAGLAWGCRLMPLKIFPQATAERSARAIVYAADHGARVINCSYGAADPAPLEEEAVRHALAAGAVVIAAAGNDGQERLHYPAAYEGVISVAATDPEDKLYRYSNFHPQLDVCAPGVGILSTAVGGGYGSADGTSCATPFVSGLAALLLSQDPNQTPAQVLARITAGAEPIDTQNPGMAGLLGAGRINALFSLLPGAWLGIGGYTVSDLGGDEDHQMDSGEVIELTVTLENVSSIPATGVKATLSGNEEFLWVEQGTRWYPDIPGGESADPLEPFLLGVAADAPFNRPVELLLSVSWSGGSIELRLSLVVNDPRHLLPGWPVQADEALPIIAAPVIVDLDPGDGERAEVLACDSGFNLHAWRGNGDEREGWPIGLGALGELGSVSTPAVGDINGDGRLEIIAAGFLTGLDTAAARPHGPTTATGLPPAAPPSTRSSAPRQDAYSIIAAFDRDGKLLSGWPALIDGAIQSSPVLADIDGVPGLEVIVGAADEWLHVWRSDGQELPGWPRPIGLTMAAGPAVADLDNDGRPEIFLAGNSSRQQIPPQAMLFDAQGKLLPGWPQDLPAPTQASPIITDLDADGELEIILSCSGEMRPGERSSRLYVWNREGQSSGQWPVTIAETLQGSPAVGDLDGDGSLEVVAASLEGCIYAWDAQGRLLEGFPHYTQAAFAAASITVDVDGDGLVEILCAGAEGAVHAVDADGAAVPGWPLQLHRPLYAPPSAGVIGRHGQLGVAVADSQGSVWLWELRGPYDPAGAVWPKFRSNLDNSGFLRWNGAPPDTTDATITTNQNHFSPGDRFLLSATLSNRQTQPLPAAEFVVLDVWGEYWFWPSWIQELDWMPRHLPPQRSNTEQLLEFTWPAGNQSGQGIRIWIGLLDDQTGEVLAIDSCTFSFG
jgi:subtilisin family serine protease